MHQKLLLQQYTQGWLEYLIALLHAQNADIGPQTLPVLVQTCINTMGKQQVSIEKLPWMDTFLIVRCWVINAIFTPNKPELSC